MLRLRVLVMVVGASITVATAAAADPIQVGGWFGPRLYSDDSSLGFIPEAPFHPDLVSSIAFGGRIARPLLPWLVPEFELALSPTKTTPTGADSVSVLWLDPRVHFRFELRPGRRLQPFAVVGAGAPIALSTAQQTFNSGIVGSAYTGGGVRFDTGRSFVLRFDARLAIVPGAASTLTTEVDVGFGVELQLGKRPGAAGGERPAASGPDRDGDGVADARDGCPDRAEDEDGFDDLDGCPDIDNDVDEVLDIADRCAGVPETYNGFEDDDGCPDAVPPDVDGLRGTVEGLVYGDGETGVRESALSSLAKIAKIMLAHPSIRVVLVGHADDREAKQFATPVDGQPPADVEALSIDLSRARAEAVKQALTGRGIASGRVEVEGHGAEEPVADNTRPRGRLANRRVEIKLYVPPRR